MVCSGFGHSNLYANIDIKLDMEIDELITNHGVEIFLTGDRGNFDDMFSRAVRRAKRKYEDVKLILVLPYFSNKLNTDEFYYTMGFDEIIIPEELIGVHYKRAITERNKLMIDRSDFVLTCVYREAGGAYTAMKYAEKTGKLYKNISYK